MGAITFFNPGEQGWTEPEDAYPADVLPLIPRSELDGSRVKIHHPGGVASPQLLEVQIDPEVELASHAHESSEVILVIEGELQVGSRRCPAGSSMLVPGGTLYSVTAGPEGARFANFRGAADYTYMDRQAHSQWRQRGATRRAESP